MTNYSQDYSPRELYAMTVLPETIKTKLKKHQEDSFDWQVNSYKHGLPGILNADDQGLGKTLQSISFLAWLQKNQLAQGKDWIKPVLIVAPTSLLRNWQEEVDIHMSGDKLGIRIEAYGFD